MKHTATPYKTDKSMSFYVLDENGNMVCNASTQANAEFIARACNAHDELIEMLKYIQEAIGLYHPYIDEKALARLVQKAEGK